MPTAHKIHLDSENIKDITQIKFSVSRLRGMLSIPDRIVVSLPRDHRWWIVDAKLR